MDHHIYISLSTFCEYDDTPRQILEESGIPYSLNTTGVRATPDQVLREAADATVIVASVEPYEADLLARLPKLRCISRCGVGVDAIDLAAAEARGVAVRNTPDAPSQAVAELAVTFLLALSRSLIEQDAHLKKREWVRLETHLLSGRTVGIVGFGRIGQRVATLLNAFGMRVLASDPAVSPEQAKAAGAELVALEALLDRADMVTVHASTPEGGAPILGRDELARLKPGAFVANLARGGMVDEAALLEGLESGRIGGAGLDVFSEEPYDGPLLDAPRVILSPHSATRAAETRIRMEIECVQNAVDFVRSAS
ncbi:MAG: phosphoglycerate dehydrogenase [Longimicrobiales bacterium]